jgi:hypothetical protein
MSTTEKMSENLMNYRDRLEEIRADWTRSDETKKRQNLQPHTPRQEAPRRLCEVPRNHGGGGVRS